MVTFLPRDDEPERCSRMRCTPDALDDCKQLRLWRNVNDGSCFTTVVSTKAATTPTSTTWKVQVDLPTIDDNGSCVFDCLYIGCTDAGAINYDAVATEDDGSCLFPGCQDEEGLNYDASANYPGECIYLEPCPGDFTGDW